MRIFLFNKSTIRVEHEKEYLDFQVHQTFNKTQLIQGFRYDGDDRVFSVVNDFLALLSEDRSRKLFETYKRFCNARNIYNDRVNLDPFERDERYKDLVKNIFVLVDYESMYDYVTKHVKVVFPDKVFEDYEEGMYPERTYIQVDYVKLIALSQVLRLVVPIWTQYIRDVVDSVGNLRKELVALKLLDKSDIIQCEPYERFLVFVEAVNRTVESKNTFLTVTGIGSEEQAEISKARKIVRRVAFADALTEDNIISAVHNEIINQPTDDRRTPNRIRDKKLTGTRLDDDDPSVIEQYKIKEALPKGEIRLIQYYLERMDFLKEVIGIVRKDIKRLQQIADELVKIDFDPDVHNLMLVKFFVKGAPPESIDVIDREYQIAACVSIYALMVHWGYYDLAILALGERVENEEDVFVGGSSNRSQIPAELDKQLDHIYPYRREARSGMNVAKQAIGEFFKVVGGSLIRCHYPDEHKEYYKDKLTKDGYYIPSRSIPVEMAEIIIKIHGE